MSEKKHTPDFSTESKTNYKKLLSLIPSLSLFILASCVPSKPEKGYPWTDYSKPENQFGYTPPFTESDAMRYECISKLFNLNTKEDHLEDKAIAKRSNTKITTPGFASYSTKNGLRTVSYLSDSEKPEIVRAEKIYKAEMQQIKTKMTNIRSKLVTLCTKLGNGTNLSLEYTFGGDRDEYKIYGKTNKYVPEIPYFYPPKK